MHRPSPLTTVAATLLVALASTGQAAAEGPRSVLPAATAAPVAPTAIGSGLPAAAELAPATTPDTLRPLELQVQQMLAEARRQQDALLLMRHRLDDAEAAARWLPWLWLALAGLGALAVWLGLRVRRLQGQLARSGPVEWPLPDDEVLPADPPPERTGRVLSQHGVLSRSQALHGPAQALPTEPSLAIAQTGFSAPEPASPAAPTPPKDFSLGTGVPPRPVSAEELLDLEQQADFFLVLEQPQSAIDLLLSHVRSTGGTQAQPYFKLLEIYQQLGDEEAYARTRERFNQRFNALAPDWSEDLAGGRALDDYPELVDRLQRAWPYPMRALAELESLLLRRPDLEPLDLPAYRDVLMLHALVRDLPPRPLDQPTRTEPPPTGVDLLLPLDEEGALDITRPRPGPAGTATAQARLAGWAFEAAATTTTTTMAVHAVDLELGEGGEGDLDLDLSEPATAPPPRDFSRLDLAAHRLLPADHPDFDDSDLLPPPVLDPRR